MEQLGRSDEEIGGSPASAFKRLRLEMLAAERKTFISDRDAGRIDDEVLWTALRDSTWKEATLRRDQLGGGRWSAASRERCSREQQWREQDDRCAVAGSTSENCSDRGIRAAPATIS